MPDRHVVTLDLGTQKTRLCVAKIESKDIRVLSYKELPSAGVRESRVLNIMKVSEVVRQLIESTERELGIKISQIVVGAPKYPITTVDASAVLDRTNPNEYISEEEVNILKDNAKPDIEDSKKKVYDTIVQSFTADNLIQQSEDDIIGAISSTIQGNYKLFIGDLGPYSNIDRVLDQVNLFASEKVFVPHSTAEAVLSEEEKSNGVGLIELGAGCSTVTIYHGGALRYFKSIAFGGSDITSDIKTEYGLSEKLAENIKLGYGACMPNKLHTMEEKILRIEDESMGTCDDIAVSKLSEVIHSRMEEILNALFYCIKESGFAHRIRNGLVIIGGSAEMANLKNMIKDKVGCNVRIGYPRVRHFNADEFPEMGKIGALTTIGLLLEAKNKSYNCVSDKTTDVATSEAGADAETITTPQTPEATQADSPAAEYEGTVFGGRGADGEEIKNKDNEKKKTRSEPRTKPKIKWQLPHSIEKIGDAIGSLFDSMNEENE